jgi:hypothetical protein
MRNPHVDAIGAALRPIGDGPEKIDADEHLDYERSQPVELAAFAEKANFQLAVDDLTALPAAQPLRKALLALNIARNELAHQRRCPLAVHDRAQELLAHIRDLAGIE